jgi:hypothetical protein
MTGLMCGLCDQVFTFKALTQPQNIETLRNIHNHWLLFDTHRIVGRGEQRSAPGMRL